MERVSEVQLLVLLSFILQLFLFFTGGLRRRRRHWLVRGTIWLAYLGADVVAIYALGFLSRHADAMQQQQHNDASSFRLAFLWAPFLLIHLGGQDTITAFAMEDNHLWLRHLLNLLLQVTLALYVFWKSSSWRSTPQVLVPGILLFVAGIIKYGERTAALRHAGNLNSNNNSGDEQNPTDDGGGPPFDPVDSIVRGAVRSAPRIRKLFARRNASDDDLIKKMSSSCTPSSSYYNDRRHRDFFWLMDVELGMMYSDVYTKAAVLRTKRGIVFRCISLACTVAALILFFFATSSSSRADDDGTTNTTYSSTGGGRVVVDTVITYTLFVGALVVDVGSLLAMVMASPRTWAWLWARGHCQCGIFARMMSSGWLLGTATRPLWSNTMGQYRFVCYDEDPQPPTLSERAMGIIRKLVCSEEEKKLFWLSKLLETKHVVVDDEVTKCLVEATDGILLQSGHHGGEQQQWKHLGQLLLGTTTRAELSCDFVRLVSWLHACTEVLLCEAAAADDASADVCRKLSRYMTYLVAAHPAGDDLLQQVVCGNPETEYESWERYSNISLRGKQQQIRMGLLRLELEAANRGSAPSSSASRRILASSLPLPGEWKEILEELKRMWARLLVYAAAKSTKPEAHAAELARGGELLTFVWLLLSHRGLGADFQLDLVPPSSKHQSSSSPKTYYVFKNLPDVHMVVSNCCPQLLLPPEQLQHQIIYRIPPVNDCCAAPSPSREQPTNNIQHQDPTS